MIYHSMSFSPKLTDNLFSERLNQIDKIFSTLTGEKKLSNIPEYNIIKMNGNQYQLEITVPGFEEKELEISIENKKLIITGKYQKDNNIQNENKNIKYLHQGIKNKNFSIHFDIYNPIQINKATLKLGILIIQFEYEIPKNQKIQKINIEKE
ncbi:Hsp20 family protein [Buchnera aphidicola]|uniref:Hsp20 family protein n=1 Tax=Buchnera aphidicola TaxID=9 RepID=UPI0034647DFA